MDGAAFRSVVAPALRYTCLRHLELVKSFTHSFGACVQVQAILPNARFFQKPQSEEKKIKRRAHDDTEKDKRLQGEMQ